MSDRRRVAGRGKITKCGYQPENHEWLDTLAPKVNGRRIGLDPGSVPLETLSVAGHPTTYPEGARVIVSRMNEYGGRDEVVGKTRLTSLRRRYCYPCRPSDGFTDGPSRNGIRECATIDCPCWQYRLGFNPHHPRRGVAPFPPRNIAITPPSSAVSSAGQRPLAPLAQRAEIAETRS
jgi:hypothetical protein